MMRGFREQLRKLASGYCEFFFFRPVIGVIVLLAIAVLAASQARHIGRDGSIEGFFRPDSEEIANYSEFRRQFGQDGLIVVAVESDTLFSLRSLQRLAELHRRLADAVPHLEDITSLLNARSVVGDGGQFVVNDLLDDFLRRGDRSPQGLEAFRRKVLSHPVYRDFLVSGNGKMALLLLRPDRFEPVGAVLKEGDVGIFSQIRKLQAGPVENRRFLSQDRLREMVAATRKVIRDFRDRDFRVYLAGSPVASSEIVRILSSDMPRFTRIGVLVLLLAVFVMTRRISAVVSLVAVIVLAALTTFGLMAATGTAIKPPTQILPSIILVVSACTVLHVHLALSAAVGDVETEQGVPDKHAALILALRRTAFPVAFTSVTTMAGLLAFAGSPLAPVSDLGVFGAFAVAMIALATFAVLSVMFRISDFSPVALSRMESRLLSRVEALSLFSLRKWRFFLLGGLGAVSISLAGMSALKFHHNALEWLPVDNRVRQDTAALDGTMHGSINLEILVRTGRKYGVHSEPLLRELENLARDIPALARRHGFEVGKVMGVTDLLKEINHALAPDGAPRYRLPGGNLIAREFFLFENSASDDLPDFVDRKYAKTRITIKVPWLEAGRYTAFIEDLRAELKSRLEPLGVRDPVITGSMALLARTSTNVIRSMVWGYAFSLVVIWGLMLLAMRHLALGVASMIPNLLPVTVVLGFMGVAGIPLDSFTVLIGCIALGLLVDDTIHFFHHVRTSLSRGGDAQEAIREAVRRSSLPIIYTSVAVILGFLPFMQSSMSNVVAFGWLVALAAALGLLAELVISPAVIGALEHLRAGRTARGTAGRLVSQTGGPTTERS